MELVIYNRVAHKVDNAILFYDFINYVNRFMTVISGLGAHIKEYYFFFSLYEYFEKDTYKMILNFSNTPIVTKITKPLDTFTIIKTKKIPILHDAQNPGYIIYKNGGIVTINSRLV